MKYSLAQNTFDMREIDAAINVLTSGFYTMGENVAKFEKELASWTGAKHAIMVNSGSSANLLILEAMLRGTNPKLKIGDQVLVPSLTWATSVWPVAQLGLVPVFIDVDEDTLALDTEKAQAAVTEDVKALFLVHALGKAADMDKVQAFCKKNDLVLIEDCCESLGAYYGGSHVGLFGVAGSVSHYFSHHLTTIEGGSIITNDDVLAEDLRSMRAFGWIRDRKDKESWIQKYPNLDPKFMFNTTGYNLRPTDIQGAIGIHQIDKLDEMLRNRHRLAGIIADLAFSYFPQLEVIGRDDILMNIDKREDRRNSWMFVAFRVKDTCTVPIKQIRNQLELMGVETRSVIAGDITQHPAISKIDYRIGSDLTVSQEMLANGFMVGCHPETSEEEINILFNAFSSLKN